jgi:hypothetical protein
MPDTQFSDEERADPLLATKRLLLAGHDMDETRDAAQALQATNALRRPLETAMVVSYARPWTHSSIKSLDERWLPTERFDQDLHAILLRLRSKVYAHSDADIGARGIRDVGHMLGSGRPDFAVEWRPIDADYFPAIEALAERQRTRFKAAAREISSFVTRLGVEVRWPSSDVIAPPERHVLLDELEAEVFALVPTSKRTSVPDRVAELALSETGIGAGPTDVPLSYAIKRLLRAARQWWKQLQFEPPALHLTIGAHTYVFTEDLVGDNVTPAQIAEDHLSPAAPEGFRRWDRDSRSWG